LIEAQAVHKAFKDGAFELGDDFDPS